MNHSSLNTLSFIFDNTTDHMLFLQVSEEGPQKRKHTGLKGTIGLTEEISKSALRNILESAGLVVSQAVLRGVIKAIDTESQSSVIYFIYEASRFTGDLSSHPQGRLKWVDILNVFNLQLEGLVEKIMPYLLDGESFFEGSIYLNAHEEVQSADIKICNSI
ncbi:MAG TPA: hypothetical protein VFG54_02160 [Prolixibacteraceae bacterium]|nr:hypothetical protein [Prolixibacteraceae bacterium]